MRKSSKWALILSLGLILAACETDNVEDTQPTPEVEDIETETETETEIETNAEQETFQNLLDQAQAEYSAEQYDAAAGTLSVLLRNDLSEFPEIESEAEELLAEVNTVQAELAREVAGSTAEASAYAEERQSAILTEQYLQDTGQDISEATDEELETWLAERQTAEEPDEEVEEPSEEPRFETTEEAEDYAFEQTLSRANLESESYFYFVNTQEDGWVHIEARETQEQDGVEWSNMIGIYRFNVYSDELEKMDSVTGEFVPVD